MFGKKSNYVFVREPLRFTGEHRLRFNQPHSNSRYIVPCGWLKPRNLRNLCQNISSKIHQFKYPLPPPGIPLPAPNASSYTYYT